MRRLLALVLIVSLLVLPMPVRAEEPHAIVLACSDFQCFADSDEGDYSGVYTENLAFLQKTMSVMGYDDIDGFLFGGDYNFADTTSSRTKTGTGLTAIRESVCARYPSLTEDDFVMIQGNHDAPDTPGMAQTGPYEFDAYSVYAINEDDYMDSSSSRSTITRTGQALEAWLREKAEAHYDHPIFIASHLPLHFNTRTQRRGDAKYAHALFDPLNEYGKTLNIIFLFGHNHARGYDSYLGGASIFLQRGDTIQLAVSGSKTEYTEETLNFTYMNYGYTGYFWFNYDSEGKGVITDNPPADNALTMTSFEITGNTVTIRRWDENGPHNLKSPGKKITTDINGLDYYDQWDANSITYGPVMQVLPPVVSADLTALAQTIAKAQALTPERYTADSRSAFDEALKAARGCTDAQPQAEIDQACAMLQAAMDGLVLRSAEVEAAIDAIGIVTLDRAEAIQSARTALDALPPELQAEVKNIEALRLAEQTLQNLQAIDAAETIIDAIGIVTLDRAEAVQAARTALDALPPELQAEVKNIEALRLAEQTLQNLQAEASLDCHGDSDACVSARFTDVPPYSNWAHLGIDYCVGKGLFDGTGASTFSPKQTMTRAMLVTVLWRCAGQPEAGPCDFQDVEAGRWYTAAIAWAAENGIVKGTAPGKFDPNAPVTRQQLAAILYRYDGAQSADFDLSPIPDAKEISTYAIPAIRWALSKGILTGSSVNGTRYLLPKSGATREQVAAMLMRYLKSNTRSVQMPTKYDDFLQQGFSFK